MAYLSRDDIERIAEGVICQYKEKYLPERRMCYMVDATELAELLGFKIEYVHITRDGSILGQTSSGRIWTEIFDDNMNKIFFELDGSTILVDKRLLSNPKIAGRKNFTIAHEIAHQIINRRYPEMYDTHTMGSRVYANYAYDVKTYIFPYFRDNPTSVLRITPKDLEVFYRYERQEDDASAEDLLQYHEAITACLDYAEELGWIEENPAEEVNPCVDQAPIMFDEFILEWLEIMRTKIGETTYASYKSNVENCIAPYFKKKRYTLQELERHPKYIQEFYQSLLDSGLSSSTVIRRHANVRKCLQYAFQIGLIKSNPADRVEKPRKAKYDATIYNQAELDKLFKVVKGDPLELAVILGAFYGLRRSEVVGLKWDAIDFERKTISIRHTVVQFTIDGKTQVVQKDSTKTKSSCRTLPLVAPFEALLLYLKSEQAINQKVCGNCYCQDYLDYIYVDAMGGLVKPNFITQHFDLLLKKHDMKKIRFHDLRHSCASLLYANGVALKDIQEWLGHSDIGTTSNIYTHLDYSNKVSSANAIMSAYPNTICVGAIGQ